MYCIGGGQLVSVLTGTLLTLLFNELISLFVHLLRVRAFNVYSKTEV